MVIDADHEQYPSEAGFLLDRVKQRGSRIILQVLQHFGNGIFPSGDGRAVLDDLHQKYEQAEGDDKVAYRMILANTLVFGSYVQETASEHYKSMWARDLWYVQEYAGSKPLTQRFLEEFGETNHPTEIYYFPFIDKKLCQRRDDETKLLWMITALENNYNNEAQMKAAQDDIDKHVRDGRYITIAGNRRTNIDALDFPGDENGECTIGYLNLLHAYEKQLAFEANLSDKYDAEEAAEFCRQMAGNIDGGYFPLSDTLPWLDPGSTFLGEYLATMHGTPILDRDIVKRTLEKSQEFQMEQRGLGLVTETNQIVPAERFIKGNKYQEKLWPLWDTIFKALCEADGLNNGGYRKVILDRLRRTNWAEHDGAGPEKQWQAWNVYILKMFRDLDAFKLAQSLT